MTSPPPRESCGDRTQLSVICTGASRTTLSEHLLPGDARLQHVLGGTRQALNVRVLAHLLREHHGPLTHDAASDALDHLLSRQPALVRHDRRRCSDAEVADFIRTRLQTDPSLSHSRLLREFRDDGNACEQSRFAALFAADEGRTVTRAAASSAPLHHATSALPAADEHVASLHASASPRRRSSQIADISRVARDQAGDLIGYQRPEVRQHIQEIVDYLDGDEVVFPNPIILALSPDTQFTSSRGPKVSDGLACSGTIEIPLPGADEPKPGWIVDGQQRALALARTKRRDFPVPVNAFVTHSVELQRDQFLRINNTKPLPRGLVTELLPSVKSPLPPRLSMRRTPSELCDVLNRDPESPFFGLIRRPSSGPAEKKTAVIADTSIVNMLKESFGPTGCLFLYRNTSTSETDFDGVLSALYTYWHAVRETFPEAWGRRAARQPTDARRRDPLDGSTDGPDARRREPPTRRRPRDHPQGTRGDRSLLLLGERTVGGPRPEVERSAERPTSHQRTVELPPPPPRRTPGGGRVKFFFPDSQDQVDPSFDFVTERRSALRVRQRDDHYAHEALGRAPYDGVLVSKTIVDGTPTTSGRYSLPQRHRLYRVGVRRFFRLDELPGQPLLTMGDCGAFTYVRDDVPPYTVDEVIDFYDGCGFDLGLSLDHVILGYLGPDADRRGAEPPPQEWVDRQQLTLELAAEFRRRHRARRCDFDPVGVAQGWSPKSFAKAVRELQRIGYRRIALGGMVPLKTHEILECLKAVSAARKPETEFHLLGVTRCEQVSAFGAYGVTSFDSTSPFRQAFKDDRDNYYTLDGTFTAVRVPQVDGNAALKRLVQAGRVDQKRRHPRRTGLPLSPRGIRRRPHGPRRRPRGACVATN